MSTRLKVARLLKGLGDSYSLFAGPEESFILDLIRGDGVRSSAVSFERVCRAGFILPEVHCRQKRGDLPDLDKEFLSAARNLFLHNIANNEYRLAHIAKLAGWFKEADLKVVFIKGAAEICWFQDNVDYLGFRYMADVDAVCPAQQLHEVDQLLAERGYELYSLDAPGTDRTNIINHCVTNHAHLVYDAFGRNHLELHPYVAADWNSDSYPIDFTDLLMDEARQIDVSGSPVWVPSPEHLLVQFLCHASSKKDNEDLLYLEKFALDPFCKERNAPWTVLINARLDAYQLQVLTRAKWLLTELKNRFEIDGASVAALLSSVEEQQRLEMYLDIVNLYLPELLPVKRQTSVAKVAEQRTQFVVQWSLPSVIAQIEQTLEKEISTQVADLRTSFEARMVQVEQHAQQAVENFKQLQVFQQQVAERFTHLEERNSERKDRKNAGSSSSNRQV